MNRISPFVRLLVLGYEVPGPILTFSAVAVTSALCTSVVYRPYTHLESLLDILSQPSFSSYTLRMAPSCTEGLSGALSLEESGRVLTFNVFVLTRTYLIFSGISVFMVPVIAWPTSGKKPRWQSATLFPPKKLVPGPIGRA